MSDLLTELRERHLLYQATDEQGLRAHLDSADLSKGGKRIYTGFDPTADSLTIGNLVPIMLLRKLQQAGHTPFVLLGGATGLIGDPSGKESERSLRTRDEVDANVAAQRKIFEKMLDFDSGKPNRAWMVNNIDWFEKISFLDALRDIGKHFSVNEMTKRDSVRDRLEREQGISYTEFSYMLLQAYDFLHLFREQGVTVQCAGADQWGNIVSGADLIRRCVPNDSNSPLSFGFTAPLLTKADGGKFGKTETGAIWLSHKRPSGAPGTSPYAYYQFWLNTSDADVRKYLCIFTDLPLDEIKSLCAQHEAEPHLRLAQRTLAQHATSLLHGEKAMHAAEDAARALFSGEVSALDADTLDEVFAAVASTTHDREALLTGAPLVDILAETSLAKSKREAREHLTSGAVSVNGEKADPDRVLALHDLLHERVILLRRGKKSWHVTRWE